jgi:hypothetical protein
MEYSVILGWMLSPAYFTLLLVVVALLKHSIADYALQLPFKYMYGKFKPTGWVLPLLAHSGIHGVFTFLIALCVAHNPLLALGLALMDTSIHFVMDRIKASPDLLGRYEALSKNEFKYYAEQLSHAEKLDLDKRFIMSKFKSNMIFWFCLELDQVVHHLTDVAVIAILIKYLGV